MALCDSIFFFESDLNYNYIFFVTKVTKDIVDNLNGAGGVRCMMVIKTKPVISRPITLSVVGKRKQFNICEKKSEKSYDNGITTGTQKFCLSL